MMSFGWLILKKDDPGLDWFDIIFWIAAFAFFGYRLYDFAHDLDRRDAKSRARPPDSGVGSQD